jgi:hypothetical protein
VCNGRAAAGSACKLRGYCDLAVGVRYEPRPIVGIPAKGGFPAAECPADAGVPAGPPRCGVEASERIESDEKYEADQRKHPAEDATEEPEVWPAKLNQPVSFLTSPPRLRRFLMDEAVCRHVTPRSTVQGI